MCGSALVHASVQTRRICRALVVGHGHSRAARLSHCMGQTSPKCMTCQMPHCDPLGPAVEPPCVCSGQMGAVCAIGENHTPLCVAMFAVAGLSAAVFSGIIRPSCVLNGSLVPGQLMAGFDD